MFADEMESVGLFAIVGVRLVGFDEEGGGKGGGRGGRITVF